MATFREGLVEGIGNAACTWLDTAENFWESVSAGLASTTGIPPYLVGDKSPGIAKRLLCDDDDPVPVPPPLFMGGQCPGVLYDVSGTIQYQVNGFPQTPVNVSGTDIGPIEFFTSDTEGSITYIGWRGGNGVDIGLFVTAVDASGTPSSSNISRVDGQPDDCGNPNPQIDPSLIDNSVTNNITYINNNGTTVNESVTYAFGFAYVDVNAELNIPVTVDVGGINVPVRLNVSTGDIVFNIGGRGGGPEGGGGDDVVPEPLPPDSPPDTPDPTPPPEDPQDEPSLIGVLVTTTNIGPSFPGTQVNGQLAPDLFLPRLAQVLFEYRFSDGSVGWSAPIPVNNRREFVPSPRPSNTIGAQIIENIGVEAEFSLVFERSQLSSF